MADKMQGDAEQRPSRCNMVAGGGLLEILQSGQGTWVVLDLVEDDQGAFRLYRAPGFYAQAEQEAIDVEVLREELRHAFVRLEIHVRDTVVVSAAEIP